MMASPFAFPFGSTPDPAPQEPIGGLTRDGFVVTPNDTLNYMQKVDAAMKSLDADVSKSGDAAFRASWSDFFAGWSKFFADHQPWYMRLSGTVYDETEDYESTLDKWREQFIARGGSPTAPKSGADRPDIVGALKWGAAAVIAAAVAYGVYEIAGKRRI